MTTDETWRWIEFNITETLDMLTSLTLQPTCEVVKTLGEALIAAAKKEYPIAEVTKELRKSK